jgi:hypothetical protein
MTIRQVQYAFLLAMCAIVAACQYMGAPRLLTFNDRVASSYATITAISKANDSIAEYRVRQAQGKPDFDEILPVIQDDAQNVLDQLKQAAAAVAIAESFEGVDLKAAESRLVAVEIALKALQKYLEDNAP